MTKVRIKQHIQSFKDAAASIDRDTADQLGYKLAKDLKVTLSNEDGDSQRQESSKVRFPVRTGIPSQNHAFVGRDDILKDIRATFQQPSSGPACCVVHGLGGVGKTETALEFTYVHRNDYDAVFWLPAERVPDLETVYAQIAITLGLSDNIEQDDQKKMNVVKVCQWLEQTSMS